MVYATKFNCLLKEIHLMTQNLSLRRAAMLPAACPAHVHYMHALKYYTKSILIDNEAIGHIQMTDLVCSLPIMHFVASIVSQVLFLGMFLCFIHVGQ